MKKGTLSLLQTMIVGAITLLVLLGIGYTMYKILEKSGTKGQCQVAALKYTGQKYLSAGFKAAEARCKADTPTIELKDLDALKARAKSAIDRYVSEGSPAAAHFSQTEQSRYEWALDKIMADELVNCFGKGWRGWLDLKGTTTASFMLRETGAKLCILCSRVKFSQEVRDIFGSTTEFDLRPWLDANNKEGKTYYALLTQGVDDLSKTFLDPPFYISTSQAVLFVAGTSKDPFALTQGQGGVGIFDYNSITSDLGFWESTQRLGIVTKADAKCKIIIGDIETSEQKGMV